MILGLKIFITCVGLYTGIRMTGIGLAWLREFFDSLSPKSSNRHDDW